MSEDEKKPDDGEVYKNLYLALQGIISCPTRACKCCDTHDRQALQALSDFLSRWRNTL